MKIRKITWAQTTLVIIWAHEQLLGGGWCVIPVVVVVFVVCVPHCLLLVPVIPFIPGQSLHLSFLSSLPLLYSLSLLPWCWSSLVLSPSCLSSPGPGIIPSSGGCPHGPCGPCGPLWLLLQFCLPCGCGCCSHHPHCQCCHGLHWHRHSHCPGPVCHWCWGVCHWCHLALFPSFCCHCHPKWVGSLVVHLVMPSHHCGSGVACFKRWWGG